MQPQSVQDWVSAWRAWVSPGDLVWRERQWRSLGVQTAPERLILKDARAVAVLIGEAERWDKTLSRYCEIVQRWPVLAVCVTRHSDALTDYTDQDMFRLKELVAWIESHPLSNLYPRQIPLPGLDTKWLETRMGLMADLIAALQSGSCAGLGFYQRCGLRKPPATVRMRLLHGDLRFHVAGLGDITAPINEIAQMQLPVSRVYIVENVQTGLCFSERPGSIVFMGLGYGISSLEEVPWVASAECVYWGDLDTHGFAILNHGRAILPKLRSVLMDESTLVKNRDLWVREDNQHTGSLPLLTPAEQAVYKGLRQHRWGLSVRLEQERISWDEAWDLLNAC